MLNKSSIFGPALIIGCAVILRQGIRVPVHESTEAAPARETAFAKAEPTAAATSSWPSWDEPIVEFNFKEFFKNPVGPRGLELTEKFTGLDGKLVRITGHMVSQCHPEPGRFILTAVPVVLHEHEYGQADELPASATLVRDPASRDQIIPYRPGRVALTGTLHVGSREEQDGRVFHARLTLQENPMSSRGPVPSASRE